jgi:hypothetical protein
VVAGNYDCKYRRGGIYAAAFYVSVKVSNPPKESGTSHSPTGWFLEARCRGSPKHRAEGAKVMKKYFALPLLIAFAATPAFAQMSNDSPYPNLNTPGSGSEQRDDNLWDGARASTQPSVLNEDEFISGRSSVEGPPPNIAEPGSDSELRDDNVWSSGESLD